MAVVTREELIERIRGIASDDTTDEVLSVFEDVTDTLDSMTSGEDWKQKYEENDKAWREKYRDRFLGKIGDDKQELPNETVEEVEETKVKTYDDLFEKE